MSQYGQSNLSASGQAPLTVASVQSQTFNPPQFSSVPQAGVQTTPDLQTYNQNLEGLGSLPTQNFVPPPRPVQNFSSSPNQNNPNFSAVPVFTSNQNLQQVNNSFQAGYGQTNRGYNRVNIQGNNQQLSSPIGGFSSQPQVVNPTLSSQPNSGQATAISISKTAQSNPISSSSTLDIDEHESPEMLALSIYANVFTAMTDMDILEVPEDQRIPYLQNVQDYVESYILNYFEEHFSPQDKIRLLAGQKYGGAGVYARFPDLYNKYQEAFSDLISKI